MGEGDAGEWACGGKAETGLRRLLPLEGLSKL